MNGTNLIEYYKIVEACRNLVRGEIDKDKSGFEYVAQVQKRRRKKERLYYEYKKDYFGFGGTYVRSCGGGESDSTQGGV